MAEALFQLGQKALIVNEKGEVLVVGQHPPNEPDNLWYDLPGGRVDEGENDLGKALARELDEELPQTYYNFGRLPLHDYQRHSYAF